MRFQLATSLAVLACVVAPALAAQNPGASPTYGNVRLEGGFLPDPHVVSVTAGGSHTPSPAGCSYGKVAEAPDVDLYYSGNTNRTLYIYVLSDDDTTLLINLPNGSWICNDDGFGNRNPILVIRNAPSGLYDIWVGTYGDALTSARLYITEIDPR